MEENEIVELYKSMKSRIFSLALRITGNFEDALDIIEESFNILLKKKDKIREKEKTKFWLYKVATNMSLSYVRNKKRKVPLEEWMKKVDPPDGTTYDIEKALSEIPERERTVLLLHDLEGFTHREISEMLGIAEGTSKSHLHKARVKLREFLKRRWKDEAL